MSTVSKWTPFGVALDITATAGTITRTSATEFTVVLNVSWETYYSGAQTNYGMSATSGGVTKTISAFNGTKRSSGSASFTGTFSISGNSSASKTITVTFKNFNTDNGDNASKSISLAVTVPAWTSYAVKYNANGGTGAPSAQTKWKDQTLKLSTTKPTRSGYTFKNWNTASGGGGTTYASGANYTANASATLYAQWTAITYTVTYNANGGTGAPSAQTKNYGVNLTLSGTKPTRSGYTFKGWATDSTAAAAVYQPGATYSANQNITLYAVWVSSYALPKISNIVITRESSGMVYTEFNWSTSKEVTHIGISYIPTSSDDAVISVSLSASGTSGKATDLRSGLLSHLSYNISIDVTDSGGSTIVMKSLSGDVILCDVLPKHKGIAFGKTAGLEGYADFGYKTKHRKDVEFDNNIVVRGTNPSGLLREVLNSSNVNGNVIIGYGPYKEKDGNTDTYGYDLNFGVSNIATPGTYRPYRRRGDSMTISIAI